MIWTCSKMASSQFGLVGASSLPPLTGSAAAEFKRFASNQGDDASPGQMQRRNSHSQPASAAPTPPVSPYRDEPGQISLELLAEVPNMYHEPWLFEGRCCYDRLKQCATYFASRGWDAPSQQQTGLCCIVLPFRMRG